MTTEEKAAKIIEDVRGQTGTNPIKMFKALTKNDYINIHGPEHHILDGACFLMAYHNAGGKIDKEELLLDFNLDKSDDIPQTIAKYINFYNEMRPCYALVYDIPNHYEQRYWNGELEKKYTFRNRVLSETPKFVQKKMSTSKNESE